ncbi:MAG: GFA family protein [Gammaproteobacteria bacterium]|nr:GFA family protein [Gammaproteobacteria bacterium]MDH3767203.1 GFA family protein [Gammaproteobacteria bacterium]
MDAVSDPYTGSCLCGAIAFEIDEFLPAAHCHCSMCRKFHGAAFATIASVAREKFRWLKGDKALKGFTAENGTTRTFCRHCGSSLMFSSPRAPQDEVEIALGALDSDIPLQPDAHIYVGSSANWTKLSDGLPQYVEGRSSAQTKK